MVPGLGELALHLAAQLMQLGLDAGEGLESPGAVGGEIRVLVGAVAVWTPRPPRLRCLAHAVSSPLLTRSFASILVQARTSVHPGPEGALEGATLA
ncbi:hypothetical protein D3C87_1942640 [compost metagenome]